MRPLRVFLSRRVLLLTTVEFCLVALSFVAACFIWMPLGAELFLQYEGGFTRIALIGISFIAASYLLDLYTKIRVRSHALAALQLAPVVGVMILIQAIVAYIDPTGVLPQEITVLGSAITFVVLLLWRIYLHPRLWLAFGTPQVLFVGNNSAIRSIAQSIQWRPLLGLSIAGYIVEPDTSVNGKVLGGFGDLRRVVKELTPERIIVGLTEASDQLLMKDLFELRLSGCSVEDAAAVYESIYGRMYSPGIKPYMVVFRDELSAKPASLALQSIYTNLVALAVVILTAPLLLIIGIALKLLRKGPVIIAHRYVGLHGVPFTLFRFRCSPTGEDGISRLLRRWHVDGLPQVLNLIRGEMTLIGPRADRVEFADCLISLMPYYRQRYQVKPGIIGWSQVNCARFNTEDSITRMEYDLYYIKHISLLLDAYVMISALKYFLTDIADDQESESEMAALAS
jgi:lipopolysaccharide/colanic/teichoic acid biosynthesis glycosyltransferase